MPSHSVHEQINQAVLIGILLFFFNKNIEYNYVVVFSAVFIFSTYFITPDLDIDSKIYRRWWVLRIIWYPYMKIFNHGQVSHNLLLGPVLLIVYTFIPLATIMYVAKISIDTLFFIAILSLFIATELHIFADAIIKGSG